MARYFSAMAMGGKLYPQGLNQSGGWRSEALIYHPEEVARVLASPYPQDTLVTVAHDLQTIVRASVLPAVRIWIREDLEFVARALWEEQRRK